MKREDVLTWGLKLVVVALAGWLVLGPGGPAEAQTAVRPCVAGTEAFANVPAGHPFCAFIEQLVRDAITAGCGTNPLRYCPEAFVTRGQMAVFLEKVLRFREPQVAAGSFHTCGLLGNRRVACWGDNTSGQATPPAGAFTQVAAGDSHTCGVRSDGTVACWGANGQGQATPPAGAFTQVSAGGGHNCGVGTDGTAACWGGNGQGQATPPPFFP
jgi:Regulator of chromosome condensation (RCC1) repeat